MSSDKGSQKSGLTDVIVNIKTWIQVIALAIVVGYYSLSAPLSPDRSIFIVGLLVVIGLIIVLDYKKSQKVENESRVKGALQAYADLIGDFENRAVDGSDPNRDCYEKVVVQLRRYRELWKVAGQGTISSPSS